MRRKKGQLFHNLVLENDKETLLKMLSIDLGKSRVDVDGGTSWLIDVNDASYSYGDRHEREEDFENLTKLLTLYEEDNTSSSKPDEGGEEGYGS